MINEVKPVPNKKYYKGQSIYNKKSGALVKIENINLKSETEKYFIYNTQTGLNIWRTEAEMEKLYSTKPQPMKEVRPVSNQNRVITFDKFVDKLLDKYINSKGSISQVMEDIKERREDEVRNTHDIFRFFDENGWNDDVDVANILLRLFTQTEK